MYQTYQDQRALRRLSALIICFWVLLIADHSKTFAQTSQKNTVMLILGSANMTSLQHRVDIAVQLYNSNITFDQIIVSGGCGAHSSSICEAGKMDSLLKIRGIPSQKIFKEEKSRSTTQNYCYSRKLMADGLPVIDTTGNLYVVSDHWHAIPVAACFRKADGLAHSTFHIEGTLEPRGPVDYTDIFQDCREDNYCNTILWAFVDASYFDEINNKIYYFVDNIYYRKTPGKGIDEGYPKRIRQYPVWPQHWDEHADAAYFNPDDHKIYLFNGGQVTSHVSGGRMDPGYPKKVSQYLQSWPESWGQGYIDAAYYKLCSSD